MLIYCTHITNRLQYIVAVLFNNHVHLTNNLQKAIETDQPVLNYTATVLPNSFLQIKPVELLFEDDIKPQNISIDLWNNEPVFFATEGTIGFDFLAASFYLLTRYEEYLHFSKDEHGRFSHINSLAYKHHFLHKPLINVWIDLLQKQFPLLAFKKHVFSFTPTYDVDIVYQYKHHGFMKNVRQLSKILLHVNFNEAINLFKTVLSKKKDDFDVFDELELLHNSLNLKPIYFLQCLQKQSEFDKNLLFKNVALQILYKKLAAYGKIGLHPSYRAGQQQMEGRNEILKQEWNEVLSNFTIEISRQHYLMLQFPNTYQSLINQNIKADYSMGYAAINGFRASYCHPYLWFDLAKNEITNLVIYPFMYMDNVPIHKLNQTVNDATNEWNKILEITKKYNGSFVAVFHNHFIHKGEKGKAWLHWHKMLLQNAN